MIPLLGIGVVPALVALFLYSLYPDPAQHLHRRPRCRARRGRRGARARHDAAADPALRSAAARRAADHGRHPDGGGHQRRHGDAGGLHRRRRPRRSDRLRPRAVRYADDSLRRAPGRRCWRWPWMRCSARASGWCGRGEGGRRGEGMEKTERTGRTVRTVIPSASEATCPGMAGPAPRQVPRCARDDGGAHAAGPARHRRSVLSALSVFSSPARPPCIPRSSPLGCPPDRRLSLIRTAACVSIPSAPSAPRPTLAERVAAVPYDVVNRAEAAALAEGNPYSFLHVGRSDIDLPATSIPTIPGSTPRRGRRSTGSRPRGRCVRERTPSLYLYRQVMDGRAQTGVVGCVHIDDYEHDIIRKHEKTRPDKEDDRTRHVLTLTRQRGAGVPHLSGPARDRPARPSR